MSKFAFAATVSLASLALLACSAPADGVVAGDESVAVDSSEIRTDAVVPHRWDHQSAANLECNTDVRGRFTSRSPRHFYSFPGSANKQTTFTLDGTWAPSLGAAVIVTDTHYNVLGATAERYGISARVMVKFPSDGKYFVFAAPFRPSQVARPVAYTLTASCSEPTCSVTNDCAGGETCVANACVAQPVCVQVTNAAGRFTAKNFAAGQYAEAEAWAQQAAPGLGYGISIGTCDYVAAHFGCTEQYEPVCGVNHATAATYGNECEFRVATIAAAGDVHEASAVAIPGACRGGSPSCATYYVDPAGARPTFYAMTWPNRDQAAAYLKVAAYPGVEQTQVRAGACHTPRACTKEYFPVCGTIRDNAPSTYGNKCMFESGVMASSAADGFSKGYYSLGECTP